MITFIKASISGVGLMPFLFSRSNRSFKHSTHVNNVDIRETF
jgi:hypothetical protein